MSDSKIEREQKRARLLEEVAKIDAAANQSKEERIAAAMQAHFAKKSMVQVLSEAIQTQLVFGKLKMMENIRYHLHSPLQNLRHGDAVCLEFADRRGRKYECAIAISNSDDAQDNRPELRMLGETAYHKFVKPLFWQSIFGASSNASYARECFLAESAGDKKINLNPFCAPFTQEMLPFDDETNALFSSDSDKILLLDELLILHLIEAVYAYCEALEAEEDDSFDDVLGIAMANIYRKSQKA